MTDRAWDVFAGRSVLITGHTGFMGSWLALWLHTLGAQVSGYALDPPSDPSHFVAAQVDQVLEEDIRADIRDEDALLAALGRRRPDVIFHLAAQPLVLRGLEEPRETFDVNVGGTAALCDAVRSHGRPCTVVVATSDKCYRNDGSGRAFEESDPLGGHDPYSASKAGTELVVAAYRQSYFSPEQVAAHGVHLACVRAGNVIGGGDWAADRLVPDAVRALSAGDDLVVRHPDSTRPWQHVLEPLSGYLTVAARAGSWPGEPTWNFGPEPAHELSAAALATAIVEHWGSGAWTSPARAHDSVEATTLRIAIEKARRDLGWAPRWDVVTAVTRTVAWYRTFYEEPGVSMQSRSLADIASYQQS
jgi:CDP-glucose 4,6-dehydratase